MSIEKSPPTLEARPEYAQRGASITLKPGQGAWDIADTLGIEVSGISEKLTAEKLRIGDEFKLYENKSGKWKLRQYRNNSKKEYDIAEKHIFLDVYPVAWFDMQLKRRTKEHEYEVIYTNNAKRTSILSIWYADRLRFLEAMSRLKEILDGECKTRNQLNELGCTIENELDEHTEKAHEQGSRAPMTYSRIRSFEADKWWIRNILTRSQQFDFDTLFGVGWDTTEIDLILAAYKAQKITQKK